MKRRDLLSGAVAAGVVAALPLTSLASGVPVELIGHTFVDEIVRVPAGTVVRDCRFVRSSLVFEGDEGKSKMSGCSFDGHHPDEQCCIHVKTGDLSHWNNYVTVG